MSCIIRDQRPLLAGESTVAKTRLMFRTNTRTTSKACVGRTRTATPAYFAMVRPARLSGHGRKGTKLFRILCMDSGRNGRKDEPRPFVQKTLNVLRQHGRIFGCTLHRFTFLHRRHGPGVLAFHVLDHQVRVPALRHTAVGT